MGPDSGFLRRLYAETARLLQQEAGISEWRVVVITPSRQLNFGAAEPVAEFLERRVSWVELQPDCWRQPVPLFQRRLAPAASSAWKQLDPPWNRISTM